MADGIAVGVILFLFFGMCFATWNGANSALTDTLYIPPHMKGAIVWWAQWGLWTGLVVTILGVVGIVLLSIRESREEQRNFARRDFDTFQFSNRFDIARNQRAWVTPDSTPDPASERQRVWDALKRRRDALRGSDRDDADDPRDNWGDMR